MTFEQWLKFQPSERQVRLFACAAARWLWHGELCKACQGEGKYDDDNMRQDEHVRKMTCRVCHGEKRISGLPDPRSRSAVEVGERFADGLATRDELDVLNDPPMHTGDGNWRGVDIASICSIYFSTNGSMTPSNRIGQWLANTPACPASDILDCIGGPWVTCKRCKGSYWIGCNDCHGTGRVPQPTTLCGCDPNAHCDVPSNTSLYCVKKRRILDWRAGQQKCERCKAKWRTVNDYTTVLCDPDSLGQTTKRCPACSGRGHTTVGLVQQTAQIIYDRMAWDELPVLADMLAEAGCENAVILDHLRSEGLHARGCFCLDLLLSLKG